MLAAPPRRLKSTVPSGKPTLLSHQVDRACSTAGKYPEIDGADPSMAGSSETAAMIVPVIGGRMNMFPVPNRHLVVPRLMAATVAVVAIGTMLRAARAMDEIDDLAQRSNMPSALRQQHGYSDFTDPLGRFLDLLAAGAFVDAKALKPQACAEWLANRQTSGLTGRVQIWDTEIDLNTLCAHR